ncbi:hypothetical protein OG21DRAFT_1511944 [Imleria badia]|nr:hypothetical protein OG21DRAFT_1511944 [Imleria badia]
MLPSLRIRQVLSTAGRRLYSQRIPPRNWQLAGHVPPTSLLFDNDAPALDLTEDEPPSPPKKRPAAAPTPEQWRRHREEIKKAFPDGWSPTRKVSRDAMDGLRSLHAFDKDTFSCAVLADKFKISPEAVRRILRSKWEPSREKRARLAERERRSREDWITSRRQEEKDRATQILSEARQDDKPRPRQWSRSTRVKSKEKFFFG